MDAHEYTVHPEQRFIQTCAVHVTDYKPHRRHWWHRRWPNNNVCGDWDICLYLQVYTAPHSAHWMNICGYIGYMFVFCMWLTCKRLIHPFSGCSYTERQNIHNAHAVYVSLCVSSFFVDVPCLCGEWVSVFSAISVFFVVILWLSDI